MGLCPGVTETECISAASGGEFDGQRLPGALMQSVEEVVGEALAGLHKHNMAVVTTGWVNRLMLLMPRVLSRHRLIEALAAIGDPDRGL